jgi:hypothetical protein
LIADDDLSRTFRKAAARFTERRRYAHVMFVAKRRTKEVQTSDFVVNVENGLPHLHAFLSSPTLT